MKAKPLISILVPSIYTRKDMLKELLTEFNQQLTALGKEYYGVEIWKEGKIVINRYNYKHTEIIVCIDNPKENTIGRKRNLLLELLKGTHFAFFDDDDLPAEQYFSELFRCLKENKDVDCCSLRGMMTKNGANPEFFEHSLRYKEYATRKNAVIKYERFPNHLNLIKSNIGKKFKFPEINFGEDTLWAQQLFHSGLLKTEAYIDKVLYYYRYIQKPRI